MSNHTMFPLAWPLGWERTKFPTSSRFQTSIAGALNNVRDELRRFGNDTDKTVSNIIVSSNVTLGDANPKETGVAVYFRWDNSDCCIAVDRYKKPEENLQAIAKVVEAERAKMRHGGLNIVRAAFRGYTALPPPKNSDGSIAAPWWDVLGYKSAESVTLDDAEQKYKELAKKRHPDTGGNTGEFAALAAAIREARKMLGA